MVLPTSVWHPPMLPVGHNSTVLHLIPVPKCMRRSWLPCLVPPEEICLQRCQDQQLIGHFLDPSR